MGDVAKDLICWMLMTLKAMMMHCVGTATAPEKAFAMDQHASIVKAADWRISATKTALLRRVNYFSMLIAKIEKVTYTYLSH